MTQAGLDIIAEQGQSHHSTLLPIFENYLNKPSENVFQDRVRESVIIFMGGVAKHLGTIYSIYITRRFCQSKTNCYH